MLDNPAAELQGSGWELEKKLCVWMSEMAPITGQRETKGLKRGG